MGNQDDAIYVPPTTAQTRFARSRTAAGGNTVSQTSVQHVDASAATREAAVQAIGNLLHERHKMAQDDFTVRGQDGSPATAPGPPASSPCSWAPWPASPWWWAASGS
jgi:hypothetical protein